MEIIETPEPGIRINLLILHCNILRSQVAYPPLGSPEHFCFYTLGYEFPLWVLLDAFIRTSAVGGLENGDFGPWRRSISALPDSVKW